MKPQKRNPAQISMTEEIIVDLFAGGGGASTGIETATGRVVSVAVNHSEEAILLHHTNHPYTEHYREDIWAVNPVTVCKGRPVGLLWASPDCRHFSKAKGAALVDRKIRGLAWVILRWAGTVRPRVILMENVEEFVTWGPVRKGKPVKKLSGKTFRKFLKQLRDLGYTVEYRELVAADYGAPTSRKRFVLIARCDGRPIVWPEKTHGPADSEDVKAGRKLPWRSAAEIIDWSLPMYSVFASKEEIKAKYGVKAVRPLAENTMRRIIRGVDKFTIKSGKPFIVQGKFQNQTQDIEKPLTTITSVGAHELASAQLIQYHTEQTERVRANGLDECLPTVDSSNRYGLVSACLTEYYGNGNPLPLDKPLRTVTSHDREALMAVHVAEFKGKDKGQSATAPLRTITAGGGEFGAVTTVIQRYSEDRDWGYWPKVRDLLNQYCGYHLAENEVLLLIICGIPYYIRDILLRMLAPRELYNAMGFPVDYIIDHDYMGREYKKSAQVDKCGNAVCPPMARAAVQANLPEWCGGNIETMEQFRKAVTA